MSKERELLQRIVDYADTYLEIDMEFIPAIKELLIQPAVGSPHEGFEEYRRGYDKGWKACKYCYTNEDLREALREDLREGISLRDHFAGMAMQGLLATDYGNEWDVGEIANVAYQQADAMMAEREKAHD